MADPSPTAVRDIATALGVLGVSGQVDAGFFEHPLASVRGALVDSRKRTALVAALDSLVERDPDLSTPGPPELRVYPLVDLDPNRLAIGLRLTGAAASAVTTVVLLGRVVVDAAAGVGVDLEVPLVRASGNGLTAVTGTPDGPVRLRGIVDLDGGATLAAEAIVDSSGGSFGLRVAGLVVGGNAIPPLEISSDAFSGDLSHILSVILHLASTALGAIAGGVAQDVITHLPGALGFDDAIPALPLGELSRTPGTMRTWIADLVAGDAAGLRTWIGHLAGMAGITPTGPAGRPTPAAPLLIPLVDGPPSVALAVALESDASGLDLIDLGLRVALDTPALLDATIAASLTVVRLPLGGTTPETWFPHVRAELTLPAAGSAAPLVPVPAGGDFGVGRITAGIVVDSGVVTPSVVLTDVTVAGRPYPRLDLSSAGALSSTAGTVLSNALDDLLGTTGFAEDVLVLLGLRSPSGGPTIDIPHFASDPLKALAAHHLALLTGPGWGEPLNALAHLLGAATGVVQAVGPGVIRIEIVDTAIGSLAVLATSTSDGAGGQQLDVALEVSASLTASLAGGPTPTEPVLRASVSLVRVAFAADTSVHVRGLDAARIAIRTTGVNVGPVQTSGAEVNVDWVAGSPGRVSAGLRDVVVSLPGLSDAGGGGTTGAVDLGDIALPWTPDPSAPLAGLPIPEEAIADLLRWALGNLADAAGPVWDAVARAVGDAIPDLLADTTDLPALARDLGRVAKTTVARLANGLVEGLDVPALIATLVGQATTGAGLGTPEAPWLWPLAGAPDGSGLTAWLEGGSPSPTPQVPDTDGEPASIPGPATLLDAAAGADPACAATLAGRSLPDVSAAITALSDALAGGDGLWPGDALDMGPAWGTPVVATALATAPFADPDQAAALAQTLHGWVGAGAASIVCVAPSWWPVTSWEPLLGALSDQDPVAWAGRTWAAVDLRRDPTAALGTLTAADGFVVTATGSDPAAAGDDAALAAALTRISALSARPLVLVPVATAFAPTAQWAAAAGATAVAGIAAVGAPAGGDPANPPAPPAFADPQASDAIRVLDEVFSAGAVFGDGDWAGLSHAWREAADAASIPTSARPADVGRLSADFANAALAAAVAASAALPAGLPRTAYVCAAPEVLGGLADTVAGMPVSSPPATGLGFGVRAPIVLPAATGGVSAAAWAEVRLGGLTFAAAAGTPPPVRVAATLTVSGDGPTGTGWLVGPPSAGVPVSVRRLSIDLAAEVASAGAGSAEIVLHDVRVGGVPVARAVAGSPGFGLALSAATAALGRAAATGDGHAAAVLALLRDDLAVVDASAAVQASALSELLEDTAGWLGARARARLAAGPFLGLVRDSTAHVGTGRWTRGLGPSLAVAVEHSGTAWRLTVATAGAGLDLAGVGHLGFASTADTTADTVTTWHVDLPGAVVQSSDTGLTVALAARPAVRVWPLASLAEGQDVADEIIPFVPAALGAGLLSALLGQLGLEVPAVGLVGLVRDPVGEILRRLRSPGLLPDVVAALAQWFGLPTTSTGAITLVDGVAQIAASSTSDGPTLLASTPAAGWVPVAGLHLGVSAGVTLGAVGNVIPAGSVALTVDLPAAVATAWTSVTIMAELGAAGLRLRVIPAPGDPIELVPQFSGVGSLVGAGVARFLPMVLNQLRDEIPVGPARTKVLDLASAVGIYGTGFNDGPVPLQSLSAQTLLTRSSQIGGALTTLLSDVLGVQAGGAPGPIGSGGVTTGAVAVAQTTDGVAIQITGPLGSTIELTIVTAGPGASLALTGLRIGPVLVEIGASAVRRAGALVASGTARVDVDLRDPLRITPAPSLRASVSSTGQVNVVLLPLGDAVPATDASVTLAPVPALALTAHGGTEFALRWLVVPGLEALVQLIGPALDTTLGKPSGGAAAPTLRTLLAGAGLLADGHVVAPLPTPVELLTGAVSSIASTLTISVAPELDLTLVADGTTVGVALTGTVPLGTSGWQPSLLFGRGQPGSTGLVLGVLHKTSPGEGLGGSDWDLAPKITLDDVGASLTKDGGLLQTSVVTIHDAGAWLGTGFALDPASGRLTVDPITAGVRVGGLGLPALSGGGGGNPVAGSLLGDSSRNGAPVNPPLSFEVLWTGTDLQLHIDGTGPGETLWIQVGKTFGPLHIDRIGIRAGDGDFAVDGATVHTAYISVLIDGGVVAGPLSIAVQGLGLSIPPRYATRPALWKVDLDGLAIDFRSASVTIAGGMLKAPVLDPSGHPLVVNGHPVVDYRGMLQVQVFSFGATALGAYSQVPRPDGTSYTSLFLFAAINAPIGGPPYLFLTGLAGGFGVNRDFIPPSSIDAVAGFPLIAVMGDLTVSPDQVLANMGPSLPPRDGAYWFAAGVTFTTFEIIRTRALAYFAINPQGFQIGLLGLMTAALPSAENTLAIVELGVRAWYSSVDNVLGVQAQLTANSWLFSKDCRLTGGFAFVVWFSRPQVVLTVGGYGPLYPAPDYFPQVPALGFSWRFSDDIVIKGESYFAVTPEAMMAGGRLEVSAKGGWGHGSLEVYADFILWFHPPRFEMQLGIRITGKAFGFGFDLSASVYLRLPPIYGKVHVNFMWGFDFEFGQLPGPPPFLALGDFMSRYVDAAGHLFTLRMLAGAGPSSQAETPDGTPGLPFKALPEFTLDVTSKLPARTVAFGSFSATGPLPLYAVPMGAVPALDPQIAVTMSSVDPGGAEHPLSSTALARLTIGVAETAVASALWAGSPQSGTATPPSASSLTGGDMRRVPAGVTVTAPPTVTTPAGLAPMAMGAIVDDTSPHGLLLDAPSAAPRVLRATMPRVGMAVAADGEGDAIPEPVQAPTLRWSTGRATATSATRRMSLKRNETQVWDLAHHLPSGRLNVTGTARVVVFNLMGDIVDDGIVDGAVDLPDVAAAVVVERVPMPGSPIGWDLVTRLRPITAWSFLAVGASVQLPSAAGLLNSLTQAEGVPAYDIVRPATAVCTRMAAEPGGAVVIGLDATRTTADLAAVTVAVEGGTLAQPTVVGSAQSGRIHLVYPILTRDAVTLDVSVAADPGAWSVAGTAAWPAPTSTVAAHFRANPWAALLGDPANSLLPTAAPPGATVSFVPPEPVHG